MQPVEKSNRYSVISRVVVVTEYRLLIINTPASEKAFYTPNFDQPLDHPSVVFP
ncbi:MAG TPA: hypothetical protein PLS08_06085 [Chryseolinea sp.]|nr:hypothetical protein [Chryseolinea sp.]HPH46373.1 hypothetical protein [Chryseolinea sp.]